MSQPILTSKLIAMSYVKYKVEGRKAELVLSRPDKRNALHPDMVDELILHFSIAKDDPEVKVVVFSAEGEVFSAGADLSYLQSLQSNTLEENIEDSNKLKTLFQIIYTFPKPVIAQVEGHAIAGGAGLVSVCDFVFATPECKIGYSEVRIGFVPAIVSYFLIRKIGEARATNMLLSGALFDAKTCQQFGLVSHIANLGQISTQVADFADKLINLNAGESMTLTKQLIKRLPEMSLTQAMDEAALTNAKARATDDCKKGLEAFLNKEKIKW